MISKKVPSAADPALVQTCGDRVHPDCVPHKSPGQFDTIILSKYHCEKSESLQKLSHEFDTYDHLSLVWVCGENYLQLFTRIGAYFGRFYQEIWHT